MAALIHHEHGCHTEVFNTSMGTGHAFCTHIRLAISSLWSLPLYVRTAKPGLYHASQYDPQLQCRPDRYGKSHCLLLGQRASLRNAPRSLGKQRPVTGGRFAATQLRHQHEREAVLCTQQRAPGCGDCLLGLQTRLRLCSPDYRCAFFGHRPTGPGLGRHWSGNGSDGWRPMDAANQAGLSRQYGGIHFNKGDLDGRALGASVASAVWTQVQSYISKFKPGSIACTPSPSSIQSNFNKTSIAGEYFIWFNSILTVKGLPTSGSVTVSFSGQTIQFSANGTSYISSVPDATVTFDPNAISATTTFNTKTGVWQTSVPSTASGNTFLSGLPVQVPSGGLPGGINPVTWSGTFTSTSPNMTISWKWAAAVYTAFSTDDNSLGVKATDDKHYPPYQNSDHAGTPENWKSSVTGGAQGGGGSNYTGGGSGTASVQC